MSRPIRSLLFSTLYPSSVRPGHGIFVETRLRELLKLGSIESRVLAPVPWFFSTDARFGDYATMARTPRHERWNGIEVDHPRYALVPKVGMATAPLGLALGAWSTARRLIDSGFDFDLIDAHYFFPDGVAAALLSRWLGKPFVMTARGSDLNLIGQYGLPRRWMRWASRRAAACIGVSAALVDVMRGWQVPEGKLHVMRNGVDLSRFRPVDQGEARKALGLRAEGPMLLMVGNLVELKGHALVIEAMATLRAQFPQVQLLIVGEGPERQRLQAQLTDQGLESQVRLVGAVPNAELAPWYSAADALVLASSREGWPNVLLEAMACGTPVVATRCGGVPEIVASDEVGSLVEVRDADHIAAAVASQIRRRPSRESVRRYAEARSWHATSVAQQQLFEAIAMSPSRSTACAT